MARVKPWGITYKETPNECAREHCLRNVKKGSDYCEIHSALIVHKAGSTEINEDLFEKRARINDTLLGFELSTMVTFASDRATLIEIPKDQLVRFYKIVSQGIRMERRIG